MWDWLQLHHYNTQIVVCGVTAFGAAAGVVGAFILLRKRSLTGDALSHATLPGVCLAFMIATACGVDGKSLPLLLFGALVTGVLGLGTILLLRHTTKLREDSALGIVLSVFFGAGVVLQESVSKMKHGHAAGIDSFIYGKTASMLAADAWLIGGTAVLIGIVCLLLFKEFTLLCFDQDFAGAQGWPVLKLDAVLMVLVAVVTVIGLQAVGLILVVAMLITPAAAARFWCERLRWMVAVSAMIGALSGMAGALASAMLPKLPAGAVIVLIGSAIFGLSLLFGSRRGLFLRLREARTLARSTARQHLLRAMYELAEQEVSCTLAVLLQVRSWRPSWLRAAIRRATRDGLLRETTAGWALTEEGRVQAARVVRNHRLWEIYLLTHADVATSRVDREADRIEHVLGDVLVSRLEAQLAEELPGQAMPPSPHAMPGAPS